MVPDRRLERDGWRKNLLDAATGVDLVFLDPDNGIEVPSKPIGRKGSSKYVAWLETEALWQAGCSLLIYQHIASTVACTSRSRRRSRRIGQPDIITTA